MLLIVQFPLADARRFLETTKPVGPVWPLPVPDTEFVRHFGAIRYRPLGGLSGWVGEDLVCQANRAISFNLSGPRASQQAKSRIAFRRFFSDGWAVGKLEIGFHITWHCFPSAKELGNHFLSIPVNVRNPLGKRLGSDLAQAGRNLANLYRIASSPTKQAIVEQDKWQVRSGTPLLCLELRDEEEIPIPKDAKSIDLPQDAKGIKLYHYGIPYRGGRIYMWIIRLSSKEADEKLVRTLRMYLLRLHAEHESLRLIIQSIARGEIQVTRNTTFSDNLQHYLDKAFKRIAHFEARTGDVNEEIAQMARQSIHIIRPGQIDTLLENVNDYRRYIRQSIENYARQDASIINYGYMEVHKMENTQGNTYNFSHFQAGILNIESTLTNVSQNVGNIPGFDPAEKDELKRLIEQLNVSLQKVPQEKVEDAEAMADTTRELVENISKDKPNKAKLQITLSGLKQAAENIAKVLPDVLPIAMQITAFITKSFGLV
jgi:hypothetical protein